MRLLLLICVSVVFIIGLIMVFNTSAAEILDRSLDKSTHQALFKQIAYALLGCFVALGVWFLGYENLLKLSFPLLCFFTFLLILCFIPGIGQGRNGAHRWIGFGGYTIQPSEFVKYLIPIYCIQYVLSKGQESLDLRNFLVLIGTIAIPLGLILIEPDTGTTAIIVTMLLMLLLLMRIRWKFWLLPMVILGTCAIGIAFQMPHMRDRLKVYLNPEADLRGKGHQPFQAKIATGSGQLLGRGLGESLQKLNYLPEAQNDYIAAIYAEELGFIGILFLVTLYMLIAHIGFTIASRALDKRGFYLGAAVTFLICFQALLNLGVVSGLFPSKGLNLPFMSQGGTSLMANIIGITILLNIAHASERKKVRRP